MNPSRTATAVAVLLALSACSDPEPAQRAAAPAPQAQPPQAQAAAPAADPHAGMNLAAAPGAAPANPHAGLNMGGMSNQVRPTNTGQVLSVMHSGPYSYMEVERDGKQFWLASGKVNVAPGAMVSWADAALMRNFTSKSLGRNFEEILFVSTVVPAPAVAAGPMSAAPMSAAPMSQAKVVSVSQAAGYSYIEVEDGRWLAAPQSPVKAGDVITWSGGSAMHNFPSSALNRTFDEILFVGGVNVSN